MLYQLKHSKHCFQRASRSSRIMKYHLLILWTLAVYVSCQSPEEVTISVIEQGDGIKLACKILKDTYKVVHNVTGKGFDGPELILPYEDSKSGEYRCGEGSAVYVKFRTCDSCVELDTTSVVSMAVGNLVASVVVGVAVYLIASQSPTAQPAPTKKRSDRQNLIPTEASGSGNDHYQRLRHKQPKDEYDVLRK